MKEFLKKNKLIIFLLALLVLWTAVFSFIHPERLVDELGVNNIYLIVFLLAVFGGLSTVTGTSFFIAVSAFSIGGADPFLLGIFGGIGIFISDTIFFLVAKYGVNKISLENKRAIWIRDKMSKLPNWIIFPVTYVWLGFTPLPNDLLMIILALSCISYKKILPVVFAGSITVVMVTAYLAKLLI